MKVYLRNVNDCNIECSSILVINMVDSYSYHDGFKKTQKNSYEFNSILMNSETCFCIKNKNSVSSKIKVSLVPRPFYVRSARSYFEKGPVFQHLRTCRIVPLFWNFVFFHLRAYRIIPLL